MPFGTITNALSLIRTPALEDRTYGFLTQMPQHSRHKTRAGP